MDYFQGVVTEYLRADRAMFVNTECCIQLTPSANPDRTGPHWFCDAVAVNLRDAEVFLCEVTYSKTLGALNKRLISWASNWGLRLCLCRSQQERPQQRGRHCAHHANRLVSPGSGEVTAHCVAALGDARGDPSPACTARAPSASAGQGA
jgi:hypothetical protein